MEVQVLSSAPGVTRSYVAPVIGSANSTTTYTYNNDQQLTAITLPDTTQITFAQDPTTGLLNSMTIPTGTYSYYYTSGVPYYFASPDTVTRTLGFQGRFINTINDSLNSASTITAAGTYSYSNDLLMSSDVITSNGTTSGTTISYAYDKDNLVTTAGSETLTYNSALPLLASTHLGNLYQYYTFSTDMGELSQIQAKYSTTVDYQETLTRDSLGRIATKAETYSGTTTTYGYTYDAAGRLTDVTTNGTETSHYVYDVDSNRTSQTLGTTTTTATYDAQDRIVTWGTKTYTFSLNGNLQSVSDSSTSPATVTTFTYDALGNLRTWTPSTGSVVSFTIDGQNRRAMKKVGTTVKQYYVYGTRGELLALLSSTGAITSRFVYASRANVPDYMIKSGTKYQLVTDHLGSVVMVLNTSTGAISEQLQYDEFGRVLADTSPGFQPFGFAGGLYDSETGLARFGARDYDASIGRWLSKDPILFAGRDTNLYGYVLNDPINLIDSNGNFPSNITEAGECVFGNPQGQIATLQSNIARNQAQIQNLQKQGSQAGVCQDPSAAQAQMRALQATNAGLQKQLDQLQGQCSYFYKGGL